jgi:hypothetical protein
MIIVAARWAKFREHLTDDEIFLRHIHMSELQRVRAERISISQQRLVTKSIVIMDLTGIPVFLDWALLRMLKRFSESDQLYYPETLKHLLVINAPSYFTAIWAVVKPWIDEETIKKVQIFGNDFLPFLLTKLDANQIPVEYGGEANDWTWEWPTCYVEP